MPNDDLVRLKRLIKDEETWSRTYWDLYEQQKELEVKRSAMYTSDHSAFCKELEALRIKVAIDLYTKGISGTNIVKIVHRSKAWIYDVARYRGKFTDEVRTRIRERDGNKCRECGNEGHISQALPIHHIGDPLDQSDDNLVTLCLSCHTKTEHTKRKLSLQNKP